jgi:hypothetical protein
MLIFFIYLMVFFWCLSLESIVRGVVIFISSFPVQNLQWDEVDGLAGEIASVSIQG